MGCVNDRALWIVLCTYTINLYTTIVLFYVLLGSLSSTSSSGLYYYGPLDQVLGVHVEQYNSPGPPHFVVFTMC